MIYYILSNLLTFFISFILLKKNKKNLLIFFNQKNEVQNFNKHILPFGGILLSVVIFLNFFSFSNELVIFAISLSILGFFSDIRVINNPNLRLIIMIIIITLFIFYSDIMISSKNFPIISNFLENNLFNSFFVLICILIVINGSNFIDGLNNNLNLYLIFFNLVLIYIKSDNSLNYDLNLVVLFFAFIFLIFNYKNILMFGDSGAYLIGFFMATETIYLTNLLQNISKYFAIIILIYPCYEVLFSVIRKLGKNPFKPDNKHLHMLLKKKTEFDHLKSSLLLNVISFIIFLIGLTFLNDDMVLICLIFIYIILYNLLYQILTKFE